MRGRPWVAGIIGGTLLGLMAGTLLPAEPAVATLPTNRPAPRRWYTEGQEAVRTALEVRPGPTRATNVILFVGDGMGIATVTAARILEGQQHGQSGEENRLSFETMPYVALSKTYSANQQVPDSAPTMTAMVTGVKTNDGVLSLDDGAVHGQCGTARGHEVTTLLELAEDAGLSTGVVSTARLTHATPAATYAHTVHRDWEDDSKLPDEARAAGCTDIARQFVDFRHGDGLEVALGGGRSQFLPQTMRDPEYSALTGSRLDGRNLADEWVRAHHRARWVFDGASFRHVDPARIDHLLGLFEPSHMQYEHDRPHDGAGEPSLAEMTSKALDVLARGPKGYVLIVEGGRIDHAHHEGNAYRALTETIALSDAVRLALDRTRDTNTLVIVTADHSHGFTMAGYATRGNPILGKVVDNDEDGRPATHNALDLLGRPYTTLGYRNGPGYSGASAQQSEGPKRFPHVPGTQVSPARPGRPDLSTYDTEAPDYLQESAIPLASETHAGEDVPVFASGPAAHLLHGVLEQHVIFHVMAHALGLGH